MRGLMMSKVLANQWSKLMLLLMLAGCLGGCCSGPQGARDFRQASRDLSQDPSRDFWNTQESRVKPGGP